MTRGPSPLADLPLLHELATEALTLAATLDVAHGIQWDMPPRLVVDTDGRRAQGGVPDPVFAVVANHRRLGVRNATQAGEAALGRTFDAVVAVRLMLEEQLREARRTD